MVRSSPGYQKGRGRRDFITEDREKRKGKEERYTIQRCEEVGFAMNLSHQNWREICYNNGIFANFF
jgi:hypothetical protein